MADTPGWLSQSNKKNAHTHDHKLITKIWSSKKTYYTSDKSESTKTTTKRSRRKEVQDCECISAYTYMFIFITVYGWVMDIYVHFVKRTGDSHSKSVIIFFDFQQQHNFAIFPRHFFIYCSSLLERQSKRKRVWLKGRNGKLQEK